jgi:hypothetical protein
MKNLEKIKVGKTNNKMKEDTSDEVYQDEEIGNNE